MSRLPYFGLFVYISSCILNSIHKNNKIKSIQIGRHTYKISQYADDMSIFTIDINSLKIVLQTIDLFAKCTGLCMNKSKTESIWIGASSNFRHKPLYLTWKKYVKILGVYVTNNLKEIIRKKN